MFGILLIQLRMKGTSTSTTPMASPLRVFDAIAEDGGVCFLHEGLLTRRIRIDMQVRACLAALIYGRRLSAIYVVSELPALVAGAALRLVGWRGRLVVVVHAVRSKRWKLAMRLVGRRVLSDVICVSKRQARICVDEVGFPADRVHWLPNWVDCQFFNAGNAEGDPVLKAPDTSLEGDNSTRHYVFSCGREKRDYNTMIEAGRMAGLPMVISASGFFADGTTPSSDDASNIQVISRRVSWTYLRTLYRYSRFVVIPLNPVNYAAGVTGLVEAMAMGKAIIVTRSPGIEEYIRDVDVGIIIPPDDPVALASAMRELWQDPVRCKAIGQSNRKWVETHADVRIYARRIRVLLGHGSSQSYESVT